MKKLFGLYLYKLGIKFSTIGRKLEHKGLRLFSPEYNQTIIRILDLMQEMSKPHIFVDENKNGK